MASVRDYAILWVGARQIIGGAVVGGGNAVLNTAQHDLDGPEHLHPDSYVKAILGGEEALVTLDPMGAAATVDLSRGNYFYGTLTIDCTFTFTGANTGYGDIFTLELAGTFDPTWPGSVVTGDIDPGTGTRLWVFVTRDGGTTWRGYLAGSGSNGGDIVPYYIPADTSFTVPIYKQGLFKNEIEVVGELRVLGMLLGVT